MQDRGAGAVAVESKPVFKYAAFISYSHKDEQWAAWLHKELESYRLPKAAALGAGADARQPIRVGPVFRDREELAAGASLHASIVAALQASEALVVVCSPHASASKHVDLEIREFKRLGRGLRILALIVDGEPGDSARGCFPRALTHDVDADGTIGDSICEPIAADVREGADGRNSAKLKVLAGLLGIDYAHLSDRHARAERVRARKTRLIAWMFAVLAVAATAGAVVASVQRAAMQRTQSRFLADQANQRRQAAAVTTATLLSLEALPDTSGGLPEWLNALWRRPWVAEAEAALYGAVHSARPQVLFLADGRPVVSVRFHPDGRHLASGSANGLVRLWTIDSPDAPIVLSGHEGEVETLAFSPDGRLLLTTARDATARVWHSTHGTLRSELEGHTQSLVSGGFSPDGTTIVTLSFDNTARLWRASDGALLHVLKGHDEEVAQGPNDRGNRPSIEAAAFSPDGALVATAARDGVVIVWSTRSGAIVKRLAGHAAWLRAVKFAGDGSQVLSMSSSDTRLWDLASGRQVSQFPHTSLNATFSEDGTLGMSGSSQGVVIWTVRSGAVQATISGVGSSTAHAFSPDGAAAVTASENGTVRLSSTEDGRSIALLDGHSGRISSATFSTTGARLATASEDGGVRLWDLTRDKSVRRVADEDIRAECKAWACHVLSMQFSPDGSRFVVVAGLLVSIRETTNGKEVFRIQTNCPDRAGERCEITSAAFSPDGKRVAAGGSDKYVRVWSVDDKREIVSWRTDCRRPSDLTCTVDALAWSRDGAFLATASSADGSVRLWETRTGRPTAVFDHAPDNVIGVDIGAGGSRILTYTRLQQIGLWDQAGVQIAKWKGPAAQLADSTGRLAVETGGAVEIVELASGRTVHRLGRTELSLRLARFSPDGGRVLAWSLPDLDSDLAGGVYVWDTTTGQQIAFLPDDNAPRHGQRLAEFSADGQRIVTSNGVGTYLWHAGSGSRMAQVAGRSSRAAFSPDGSQLLLATGRGLALAPLLPSRFDLLPIARLSLPPDRQRLTATERAAFFLAD